jgi:hypothetical protein
MKLTAHLQLMPRSRICGYIHPRGMANNVFSNRTTFPLLVEWKWSTITDPAKWSIVPALDVDECGVIGGMLGKGNSENSCPIATFPPQFSHNLTPV